MYYVNCFMICVCVPKHMPRVCTSGILVQVAHLKGPVGWFQLNGC